MNRTASTAVNDVDLILFVVESLKWNKRWWKALSALHCKAPVLLIINKDDLVKKKETLLAYAHDSLPNSILLKFFSQHPKAKVSNH